jgi:hypothetical protein
MDSNLPPVEQPLQPNPVTAAPAAEAPLTPTEVKVKNLFKSARSKGSGSTLNVDNIKSLVQWWSTLIEPTLWKESRRFLSDKYLESTVMRTHDFELLKAMRNFIQAGDHLAKLIDVRVDEINKVIEDNRELFEQLAAEQKELEEKQKIEAARLAEPLVPPANCALVDCNIVGPHTHDSSGPAADTDVPIAGTAP